MGLIQETMPGLYNGVSQQPATLRLKNQCEVQKNALGSLVYGLHKRPPCSHFFYPLSGVSGEFYTHAIERDKDEKYLVFFTDVDSDPIVVWDVVDEETKTVNYGHLDADLNFTEDLSVKDYLNYDNTALAAQNRIRATTIADYTIVVNRHKTPATDSNSKSSSEVKRVFIIVGNMSSEIVDITINGETFSTGDVGSGNSSQVNCDAIYNTIVNNYPDANNTLTVWKSGHGIYLHYDDNRELDVQITDQYVKIYHNTVPTYDDLWKATTWDLQSTIRVLQDTYGNSVHYYVKPDKSQWVETVGWDLLTDFDATTMPHRLVRMSDGTFVFADINWGSREIGDEDSAPIPSFVGRTIENVFFHQNRLGFLTKANVIMSRTAGYFNFWPQTAMEDLADDPVDVGVATTEVTTLREAIPFNKNLLLRADTHQFVLSYTGNGLSPQTISIDQTTKFPTVPTSISTSAGANLYFVSPQQNYLAVREYYVQPESLVENAQNTTIHVPTYIPEGDTVILHSVPQSDMLILFTSGDPYSLYIYQYFWEGDKKPQAAWSRWKFAYAIRSVATIGGQVILMLDIEGENHGFVVDTNPVPYNLIYLDMQIDSNEVGTDIFGYSTSYDVTYFNLPYSPADLSDYTIVDVDTLTESDGITRKVDDSQLTVPGDQTGKHLVMGKRYEMLYEFSRWILKDNNDKVLPGRLQFRSIQLQFKDTGYFEVHATPEKRDTLVRTFNGLILDQSSLDTGNLFTGEKRFMILGKANSTQVQLKTDSYLPCVIQGVTFEGFYHSRGQTIG